MRACGGIHPNPLPWDRDRGIYGEFINGLA